MAVQRLIFGKMPVSRGNWLQSSTYYKYNIVTQGSSSFMAVWDGDPFSGIMYKPGVFIDPDGNYIVTINGIPQGLNSTYWQLLSYGVNEAEIISGYIEADEVVKAQLLGLPTDTLNSNTILGVKNGVNAETTERRESDDQIIHDYKAADSKLNSDLLGTPQDTRYYYTINGVRKYVSEVEAHVNDDVIGTNEDTQSDLTLHGLRKYANNISDYIGSTVIGQPTDTPSTNSIYGLRNALNNEIVARGEADTQIRSDYANADDTLKRQVVGYDTDEPTDLTLNGVKKYAESIANQVQTEVIGTDEDTAADLTLHGVKKYAENIANQVQTEVIGTPNDDPTVNTINGLRKAINNEVTARDNADTQIRSDYANADNAVKSELLGTDEDDKNDMTIKGNHNYINSVEEKVANQIYAIGFTEDDENENTYGTVYIQCDTDNTLVNAEDTEIDQTTGEVIVALNL